MNYKAEDVSRAQLTYMAKHGCSPEDAEKALSAMVLSLYAGERIKKSFALQAALLTAINTGKRAFSGGIVLKLPADIPCLVPGEKAATLNETAANLCGDKLLEGDVTASFELRFGLEATVGAASLEVVANSWQGGYFTEPGTASLPEDNDDLPLGGIFAAGLSVSAAFFRVAGIDYTVGNRAAGLSLWKPNLNWRSAAASGPAIEYLPKRLWVLGLGHLGQAYCWAIGMLPFAVPGDVSLLLQDDDIVNKGNYSAGLLNELSHKNKRKTRVCAAWFDERGLNAKITERRFDKNTVRAGDEPFVALCGFDNALSRSFLEGAGFRLVTEAALGGDINDFDRITYHSFPNASKTPKQYWEHVPEGSLFHENVAREMEKAGVEKCGSIEIAGKSLSVSFVGACAAAVNIAEIVRAANCGPSYELLELYLRSLQTLMAVPHPRQNFSTEIVQNGLVEVKRSRA